MKFIIILQLLSVSVSFTAQAFAPPIPKVLQSSRLYSSFAADGSEYSSNNDNNNDDEDMDTMSVRGRYNSDDDETPTQELTPVPMSKNSGNRFVAIYWDQDLDSQSQDVWDLHEKRVVLTEDHVMYCRKANFYNETFNTESMVDVIWSLPILSVDLKRLVGHAICLESTAVSHVHNFLQNEPLHKMLVDDPEKLQLYRWRQIRDYSLRRDDGRFGYPCLCLGLDADSAAARAETEQDVLQYLIQSERVIAAGSLFLPTEFKNDPSSLPVGDLILFNAPDRQHAIQFAENLPSAQAGLYDDLRVYFYNTLDITGKFVSEDPLRDAPCEQMKEALEYWGYPVADEQTPWLNW